MPLAEAFDECVKLMGLKQQVRPRQSSRIVYRLEVDTSSEPAKRVTIADVGFGYSQVLPIILRGLLAPRESLVLFEQPEIHLHPSCRANLADLFLGFASTGRRVIVETHSTELIDRLRLHVVQDPSIAHLINLVFVEGPKPGSREGSTIRQLSLDEDGMLDDWPEGFCDESEKLARALIEARTKKKGLDG
jgi:predicted ATPase